MKSHKAKQYVCTVLDGAGVDLVGTMSRVSVARMVRERYVAAVVQAMDKIRVGTSQWFSICYNFPSYIIDLSSGWTGSADGTTHRHVKHLAHMYPCQSDATLYNSVLLYTVISESLLTSCTACQRMSRGSQADTV